MFVIYCEKIFGIPKEQIKFLKNATAAEINQSLAWLNNLSNIEKGNAELTFYYSGHGLPDERTREAYIIPVDVSAQNIEFAIKLSDIYSKLTEYPAKKITVFLDACFSGGARNKSLLASIRPIQITSKKEYLKNNIIVFTSSSGEESSAGNNLKKHGFFTYFLLKKLQETKGNVNYGELSDYIIQNVRKETGLIGKIQTPQVIISDDVIEQWKSWKVKD